MKKHPAEKFLFAFASILIVTVLVISFNFPQKNNQYKVKSKWQHPNLEPNDWAAMQRMFPYGKINQEAFLAATSQVKQMMTDAPGAGNPWVFSGPDNIGGRITDIESPAGNPSTIYIGASTGGILKTTDMGITWTNLFDDVPVVTVGDIAIDPTNPQVLYCGTGEANSSSYSFLGNGMYKSTDAGETWQNIGLTHSAYIGRVIVDHADPQRVYVAACGNLFTANDERGIYRSVDGGSNWQRVLYVNDSTSGIDLVQHPTNPQILYAAMWERIRGLTYRQSFGNGSGIWKSVDGGTTWSEMTNGLPTDNSVGRIGLTIAKTNPNILYAFYDLPNYEVGVFKTVDGGVTWTRTNDGALSGMNSNFGWYFGQIRVDPANENRVFVMGVDLFRTDNGGGSWNSISTWELHVDHHAMFFDEANHRIVEGNDGGLYTSEDNGNNWTKINNLALTQFYAIDIDRQNPERIYGGTQDNNTIRTLTGSTSDWEPILGGDGMFTLVDYTDPNTIYAEYQWGNLYRSDDGGWSMNPIADPMLGDRINWSAPLAMHPVNPATLYFGTYRVWKSTDKGSSWLPVSGDLTAGINQYFYTVTTIAISEVDPSIVVAGSGDGKIHVSTDDGQTWQNRSAGIPLRWVTRVATDPFDAQTIYATISGFRWDEPLPHVFRSVNLGQTWTDITGNLPEFPVNDIVLDPGIPHRIIVATDAGVYGSANGGLSWSWVWDGLPAVPVYMMKIHAPTRTIVAGTYGLSSYKANLDDILTGIAPRNDMKTGRLTANPNPVGESTQLKFYLPESQFVQIRIFDLNGKVAGTIFSGDMPKGNQQISWNAVNIRGQFNNQPVAPGMYLIRVEGNTFNAVAKIVKL